MAVRMEQGPPGLAMYGSQPSGSVRKCLEKHESPPKRGKQHEVGSDSDNEGESVGLPLSCARQDLTGFHPPPFPFCQKKNQKTKETKMPLKLRTELSWATEMCLFSAYLCCLLARVHVSGTAHMKCTVRCTEILCVAHSFKDAWPAEFRHCSVATTHVATCDV